SDVRTADEIKQDAKSMPTTPAKEETASPLPKEEKPDIPANPALSVPDEEKTMIAQTPPPKRLDMGFVAKDTTELDLEKRRIKKATSFVLDDEIFSSITGDIPSKKINSSAPAYDDFTEQKPTSRPTIKAERDDFPKSQDTGDVDLFDGEEATIIKQDVFRNYTKSSLATVLMFFISLLSVYISLAPEFSIPMPDVLLPQSRPFGFILANVILISLAIIVSRTVIYYGVINLFTLKADNDSLSAMATLAVLIQNLVLLLSPHSINAVEGINIYTPLAIISLFANQCGRLLATTRMIRNFKMAYSSAKDKYGMVFLPPDTAQTAMMASSADEYNVLAPMKTERFTGFIDNSVSEDLSDTISTILAPIVFVASLIITLFCYIIYRDVNLSLTALSATFCICSPFSTLITSNLPLNKIAKKLYSVGGIVTGYDALEATADADAVVVSAGDLFPKGTILLHDIKTFEQAKIDDVLVDTASVILRVGGTLQDVFSQIIMDETDVLNDVDSIVYEDSMGVSAWINAKRVLIGNRQLMQNHGVNVPSEAYEHKYKKDGRELVYLATSGTLAAMFVVSYKADEDIKRALQKLVRTDVSLCVKTSDANISADKLAEIFEIPSDSVVIMPSEIYREYTEVTKRTRTAPVTTAFLGNVLGYIGAVTACKKARKTIFISTIMQTAGIALGYVLVAYFAFMNGLTQIDVAALLIYQLSWFLVSWAVVKFNSY
ncbi:MAG: hypothetical protein IJC83_02700, partial [Oscillospiraceae bacterium]|nr:hypothetical protein [Oscillospiraceae bacterium]